MTAALLAEIVKQAISLAAALATQAIQSGAMTEAQILQLWEKSSTDWNKDWAAWQQQQNAKPD